MQKLKPFDISLTGRHLIEASAGTGKTFNIATLFVRALIEKGYSVGNILVVTYTEAATKELKDRLQSRLIKCIKILKAGKAENDLFFQLFLDSVNDRELAIERLEHALHNFDEASVYTIHGFCYQALLEQAFKSNASFDTEMIGSDQELVQEVIDDYWRRWIHRQSADEIGKLMIELVLQQGITPDTLTKELASLAAKPYLKLLPEGDFEVQSIVETLRSCYQSLQKEWEESHSEIRKLLLSEPMNGHRFQKGYLDNWFPKMDDLLAGKSLPLKTFDKFSRFKQSYVDESLKKSAIKGGIEPPQHYFFRLVEQFSDLLDELQQYPAYFKKELVEYLQDELKRKKQHEGVLSYDDLLNNLNDSLTAPGGGKLASALQKKYPIALVDEFQDTDPVQYEIFSQIYPYDASHSGLFMIGDPKQSIYSFRGADVFAYLRAKSSISVPNRHSLNDNYRSVPKLLEAYNTLFGQHENPFLEDKISYASVNPGYKESQYDRFSAQGVDSSPLQFELLDHKLDKRPASKGTADQLAARFTADRIQELLSDPTAQIGSHPIDGSDIAVLVRTHRQADIIREALLDNGLQSVQYSQQSVFESLDAEELYDILKAVAEPKNEAAIMAALATRMMGYDATQLVNIQENEQEWVRITDSFSRWQKLWQEYGVARMLRSLLQEMEVPQRVVGFRGGERLLTNISHLSELLQRQEEEGKDSIRALLHWYIKKCQNPDQDSEEEQLRLESDQNLVKIVTMHRSKGLQYPIVICPFLWRGSEFKDEGKPIKYHSTENTDQVFIDFSTQKSEERYEKRLKGAHEELAESMRLAYVALTRAEQCCILPWLTAKKSEFSALGYLLHPQKALNRLESLIDPDQKYSSDEDSFYADRIRKLKEQFKSPTDFDTEKQLPLGYRTNGNLKSARKFNKSKVLQTGASVSSFSSLIHQEHEQTDLAHYYDGFEEYEPAETEVEEYSMFSFPRGPQPGSCIHQIYELIDFQRPDNLESVTEEQLRQFGIHKRWHPLIVDHVRFSLDKYLQDGLKLSALPPEKRIPELEFHFTSDSIKLSDLIEIIRGQNTKNEGFADPGFLKGFIDLTFQWEGRFYLLDYKTNHLGYAVSDYGIDMMQDEILHHMYDLQYFLYSIALHRYLKNNIPNYSYKTHFGGAFYLFIRGLNPKGREGIFFDRPDYEKIVELDQYLER